VAMTGEKDGMTAVLHFRDGRTVRGAIVNELDQGATTLTVSEDDGTSNEIQLDELKAVFFLRSRHVLVDEITQPEGSSLAVEFFDGEVIRGKSNGYSPEWKGFFLYPTDRSKNEKVFVVNAAVVSIDIEKL
jgi:hypothetical protein